MMSSKTPNKKRKGFRRGGGRAAFFINALAPALVLASEIVDGYTNFNSVPCSSDAGSQCKASDVLFKMHKEFDAPTDVTDSAAWE